MIFDMNIKLEGIDEEFLEDLEELIEDTRVEYFIINPQTLNEINKAQEICCKYERFKYTLPVELSNIKDDNCKAFKITQVHELDKVGKIPVVIESSDLNKEFIDTLNKKDIKGVVLNAKEGDEKLINFVYSISQTSLKNWTQKGIKDIDYNKLVLQSDYPDQSYDDFLDVMLKEISDLTFRAEQTIAAGGTRSLLKIFGLL